MLFINREMDFIGGPRANVFGSVLDKDGCGLLTGTGPFMYNSSGKRASPGGPVKLIAVSMVQKRGYEAAEVLQFTKLPLHDPRTASASLL